MAGVGLAVSDINAAGGVDGAKACHDVHDSGDSNDMSVSTLRRASTLVAGKDPSVVIGAASSSVSAQRRRHTDAGNKIVEISPANTAADLSGYSPTTTSGPLRRGRRPGQRARLADQHQDGHQKVAFLVFNDTYGTGLRNFGPGLTVRGRRWRGRLRRQG